LAPLAIFLVKSSSEFDRRISQFGWLCGKIKLLVNIFKALPIEKQDFLERKDIDVLLWGEACLMCWMNHQKEKSILENQ